MKLLNRLFLWANDICPKHFVQKSIHGTGPEDFELVCENERIEDFKKKIEQIKKEAKK